MERNKMNKNGIQNSNQSSSSSSWIRYYCYYYFGFILLIIFNLITNVDGTITTTATTATKNKGIINFLSSYNTNINDNNNNNNDHNIVAVPTTTTIPRFDMTSILVPPPPDCSSTTNNNNAMNRLSCWLYQLHIDLPNQSFHKDFFHLWIGDMVCSEFQIIGISSSYIPSSTSISSSFSSSRSNNNDGNNRIIKSPQLHLNVTKISAKCHGRYKSGSLRGYINATVDTNDNTNGIAIEFEIQSKQQQNHQEQNEHGQQQQRVQQLPKMPNSIKTINCITNIRVPRHGIHFSGSISAKIINMFQLSISSFITKQLKTEVCPLIQTNLDPTISKSIQSIDHYLYQFLPKSSEVLSSLSRSSSSSSSQEEEQQQQQQHSLSSSINTNNKYHQEESSIRSKDSVPMKLLRNVVTSKSIDNINDGVESHRSLLSATTTEATSTTTSSTTEPGVIVTNPTTLPVLHTMLKFTNNILSEWLYNSTFFGWIPSTCDKKDCGHFFDGILGMIHYFTDGTIRILAPKLLRNITIPLMNNTVSITLQFDHLLWSGFDQIDELQLFIPTALTASTTTTEQKDNNDNNNNILRSKLISNNGWNMTAHTHMIIHTTNNNNNNLLFNNNPLEESFDIRLNISNIHTMIDTILLGNNLETISLWQIILAVQDITDNYNSNANDGKTKRRNGIKCLVSTINSFKILSSSSNSNSNSNDDDTSNTNFIAQVLVDSLSIVPKTKRTTNNDNKYNKYNDNSLEHDIDQFINTILKLTLDEYPVLITSVIQGVMEGPVRHIINDLIQNLISEWSSSSNAFLDNGDSNNNNNNFCRPIHEIDHPHWLNFTKFEIMKTINHYLNHNTTIHYMNKYLDCISRLFIRHNKTTTTTSTSLLPSITAIPSSSKTLFSSLVSLFTSTTTMNATGSQLQQQQQQYDVQDDDDDNNNNDNNDNGFSLKIHNFDLLNFDSLQHVLLLSPFVPNHLHDTTYLQTSMFWGSTSSISTGTSSMELSNINNTNNNFVSISQQQQQQLQLSKHVSSSPLPPQARFVVEVSLPEQNINAIINVTTFISNINLILGTRIDYDLNKFMNISISKVLTQGQCSLVPAAEIRFDQTSTLNVGHIGMNITGTIITTPPSNMTNNKNIQINISSDDFPSIQEFVTSFIDWSWSWTRRIVNRAAEALVVKGSKLCHIGNTSSSYDPNSDNDDDDDDIYPIREPTRSEIPVLVIITILFAIGQVAVFVFTFKTPTNNNNDTYESFDEYELTEPLLLSSSSNTNNNNNSNHESDIHSHNNNNDDIMEPSLNEVSQELNQHPFEECFDEMMTGGPQSIRSKAQGELDQQVLHDIIQDMASDDDAESKTRVRVLEEDQEFVEQEEDDEPRQHQQQRRNKNGRNQHLSSNNNVVSLFRNKTNLTQLIRHGIPIIIIGTMCLLLCSNLSTGASVDVTLSLGTDYPTIRLPATFTFSLGSTISEMYQAGIYLLLFLVVAFSGIWPYGKLLLMLYGWMKKPKTLHQRESLLLTLDALGKFSLVDTYVLVLMVVAFRYHLNLTNDIILDVYVSPQYGFYGFLLATCISMIIGHVMVYYHRQSQQQQQLLHLKEQEQQQPFVTTSMMMMYDAENAMESLFDHAFIIQDEEDEDNSTNRGRQQRQRRQRLSKFFQLVLFSSSLITIVLIGIGMTKESFTFEFGGLAGIVLGNESNRRTSYSLLSLGSSIGTSVEIKKTIGILFLQFAYYFYAVITPLLCLFLIIILMIKPCTYKTQRFILTLIELANAWSAIEVFALSIIASLFQISTFASFIIGDKCDFLNQLVEEINNNNNDSFGSSSNGMVYSDNDNNTNNNIDTTVCYTVKSFVESNCWYLVVGVILNSCIVSIILRFAHCAIDERRDIIMATTATAIKTNNTEEEEGGNGGQQQQNLKYNNNGHDDVATIAKTLFRLPFGNFIFFETINTTSITSQQQLVEQTYNTGEEGEENKDDEEEEEDVPEWRYWF